MKPPSGRRSRVAGFERVLRIVELLLRLLKAELDEGHDLARTLADADVADRVFARVAPVAVVARVVLVGGRLLNRREHLAELLLANARHECLEALVALAVTEVVLRDQLDGLRDVLRGNGADHQTVALGVLGPLTAEHDVEVRDLPAANLSADAGESDVGGVVLAAGVEAAARLHAKRSAPPGRARPRPP